MVAEVVADYILATMDVQLPVTCAVGRALKYGHKKLLPVYDAKIGPVPPAVSLPLPHAYRAVRIFLSGYMADGQRFPAPKYFYPATAKMVQEYIKDIHRFSPTIKTVMHAIFYYHIKGRPDEPSLNVIFSDGIQADPAVFPFFCAKSDDSVPEETVAKFQRLYGFSLATLRYHITFLNSPKQLTPSMPYDEFLPPASAAALNKKMGAPKKQQSRMEFDLITGMTRFSSPEFTCTMMVVDDKLMLWTNISLGVLQNSQMTISELGTFLTLKIKVPTAREVTPPPPLLPPVSPPPIPPSDLAESQQSSESSLLPSSSHSVESPSPITWKEQEVQVTLMSQVNPAIIPMPHKCETAGWFVLEFSLKQTAAGPSVDWLEVKEEGDV